jgi:hypothetical protein
MEIELFDLKQPLRISPMIRLPIPVSKYLLFSTIKVSLITPILVWTNGSTLIIVAGIFAQDKKKIGAAG